MQNLIQTGIDEGAKLVCGGVGRPDGRQRGFYAKPTVFSDVKKSLALFTDAGCNRRWRAGSASPGAIFTRNMEDGTWSSRRWAHEVGGNVVRHDGSGSFISNAPNFGLSYGWPSEFRSTFSYYDSYMSP